MRVLHILEATGGGTRRHVLDLLPGLQTRGVACSLIYSSLRNPAFQDDARWLQNQGIETREIAMERGCHHAGGALLQLRAHLRNHDYDLIHCHSSIAGLLGRLANTARSTPLIYTPHYIALAAGLPVPQRRVARRLEKLLAPQTSHFIAVSRHEYSILCRARLLRDDNATIIYNGVNISAFPSSLIPRPSSPLFRIGCFGRLTTQKNQQLLLCALPAIAHAVPSVRLRLRLVGEGEDESTLRALASRLNIENLIEWRGEVRDVTSEYAACDLVAQPSRWEGCSYALLEGMASGKVVVAARVGGNPEVIGSAGVLLPPHDVAVWTREIIRLARDETRRANLGGAARERVATHFRQSDMIDRTFAVYQTICS